MNVIIAADKVLYCGFARARCSNERHTLPGFNREGYILEHPVLVLIGKPNILELYFALKVIHAHRIRCILYLRFRIQQPEYTLRTSVCGLYGVELLRQFLYRLEEIIYVPLEYYHSAYGYNAVYRHMSANEYQYRKSRYVHNIRHGAIQRKRHKLLHVYSAQFLCPCFKIILNIFFSRKRLHHLHAGHMLRHKAVQFGYFGAHYAINLPRGLTENKRCNSYERDNDKYIQRQFNIVAEHHHYNAAEHKKAFQYIHYNAREHFIHRFAVVSYPCDQPAYRVIVIEAYV